MGTVRGMAAPPTVDRLRTYAMEHVAYEVAALVDQVQRLAAVRDDVLANALLESSLTHIRVLDDFFRYEAERLPPACMDCGYQSPNPTNDDVTARHYLATWDVTDPEHRVLTSGLRKRLNAQLPHLALRRTGNEPWSIGPLAIRTCKIVLAFVGQLRAADADRAAWFDKATLRAVELTRPGPALTAVNTLVASTTSFSSAPTVSRFLPQPPTR